MRLIDADELNERFESSCTTECACCPYSGNNCELVHEADTVNAIVIPDGATNGDMIKALFSDKEIWESEISYELDGVADFSWEWWNAPYKSESEEKE